MGKLIWNSDFNDILEKSKLKSKKEILDLQDLVFRYNWACVDTMIKNQELPQLNREIIYEWHYALNWLVQAYGIINWDNVQTHT